MPYVKQLSVGNDSYDIKAVALDGDANLKTINSASIIGTGNIETLQVSCLDGCLNFTGQFTDASELEG